MSRKRRNRQRTGTVVAEPPVAPQPRAETDRPPLPEWKWKTFPVYFAFALGGFIGAYVGYLTGFVHGDSGSALPSTIMFGVVAILLGFGVARLGVRGLMGWGIIRPTPRRK